MAIEITIFVCLKLFLVMYFLLNITTIFEALLFTCGQAILVLIFLNFYQKLKSKSRAPPGPNGLPIIGNLHQLARAPEPLLKIQEWRREFGNIVQVHLGQYKMVILSGRVTIKEAFNTPEFSGRPLLKPFAVITGGEKRGLSLSEGQAWVEQRRFALRNLRDFGFGKRSMESLIQEDIQDLISNLKGEEGKAFVPHRKFSTAMVRSLWKILVGEKFEYGDPKFQSVLDSIHSLLSSTNLLGPAFFMPWLISILPRQTRFTSFLNSIHSAKALIEKNIEEHKLTFQPDNCRDYIDVYLKEIAETKDPTSSFHKDMGADKHLLVGLLNLFGAGAETTSNTIVWTILYLIENSYVQDKLFDEINSVIGMNRMPSLDDREKCPYTCAVMEETFRMSSMVPLSVFHSTMEDVIYKGYHIPKDTLVAANLYGLHHDKELWGDPEVFRPERFSSLHGILKGDGTVLPFSVGKRACLGEVLARNNYFLYLTSLVQKFEFKSGEEGSIKVEASPGLTRTPKEFKIIIKERN